MKKQLKLFSILALLIIGMFTFMGSLMLLPVKATYVEGPIQQDTVWTLTDSPFEVINDIIIMPGFTLTIEPGVVVRFGGNFSLTVMGRLNAGGNPEDMITFTSNKYQPLAGDWGTIRFVSKTQQSMVAYAIVKFAIVGIFMEDANVEIRNSQISNSLQNGVYITGDNIGLIRDNTVELNRNGILLVGNTTGTIIQNNRISANTDNGIYLQSGTGRYISNIMVFNNTLSSNSRGINAFGQVTAAIMRNSISYNDLGIFFANVSSMLSPQFNDIYGNVNAMNVSTSQPINAEYNYWGDETGPYHVSLNPSGKGNPIQSDGTNLDFIPFLSAPNGYINARPIARLLSDKILVSPNQPVTFIATTSSDDRRIDMYFFDFGDGTNSGWTTLSVFDHKYASLGSYQANAQVMDDFGVISNNAADMPITVEMLTPLDVSLTLSRPNIVSGGQVSVTVRATLSGSPVSDANIFVFSIPSGTLVPQSGLTNATGYFTATFAAPTVIEQANIRITARASKSGNADGAAFSYVEVVPPLVVSLTVQSSLIKSEATTNGTVRVTYTGNPIESATVRLISDGGGSFTPQTGTTDTDGYFQFAFQAPQTLTQLNVTLTAIATKSGYWDNSAQTKVTVDPRTLTVQVSADPATVESKATTNMVVHVSSDGAPVANANVTLTSDLGGEFSVTVGSTDAKGDFAFTFTAPEMATLTNVTITAAAAKSGYIGGQGQTPVAVNPAPSPGLGGDIFGLPLTTLLLILIPVIAVVIVVVLIKAKVIVFSRGEEES